MDFTLSVENFHRAFGVKGSSQKVTTFLSHISF